jgi:hypothetical protein
MIVCRLFFFIKTGSADGDFAKPPVDDFRLWVTGGEAIFGRFSAFLPASSLRLRCLQEAVIFFEIFNEPATITESG